MPATIASHYILVYAKPLRGQDNYLVIKVNYNLKKFETLQHFSKHDNLQTLRSNSSEGIKTINLRHGLEFHRVTFHNKVARNPPFSSLTINCFKPVGTLKETDKRQN